ncbi:MAG: hypothetical protein HGJ93_02560 [Desulfosarcina sp.]|nr:hypothetical protein [Desulfosarcina sp.]MBC2764854.1 hypothetical protein [Desulfosarcina sp.]
MDSSLLIAAAASFVAGLLGYVIARLWIKPIVRYNITKRKLDHELTRHLAQMDDTGGPEDKQERQKHDDAMLRSARKHAMDLISCYGADIPYWYRLLLDSRKESPTEASGLLTNLSKIRDQEQVKSRIDSARKIMGLK